MILQIPVQTGYNYVAKLQDMALSFAPKIIGAVLVYIIGSFIIRRLANMVSTVMNRKNYDKSFQLHFHNCAVHIPFHSSVLLIEATASVAPVETP